MKPNAIFSNRLEILSEKLAEAVFEGSVKRKIVITESAIAKRFLTNSIREKFGICMGIEWMTLSSATQLCSSLLAKQSALDFPSAETLGLHLTCYLQEAIHSEDLTPIREYLDGNPKKMGRFCEKVGRELFSSQLHGMENTFEEPWKEHLWNEVFSHFRTLSSLERGPLPFDIEFHLFGIDALPLPLVNFFESLSSVSYYVFSPTEMYWEDVCSDKERLNLLRYYERKKVKESERKELESYLEGHHPLLASWGKYGKIFPSLILEREYHAQDFYQKNEETTFLERIQNDVLEMREISSEIVVEDDSISIHEHVSPKREVEGLYQRLLEICKTDSDVSQNNVLVLSPSIARYVPYIESIFGKENSPFAYRIADLERTRESNAIAGLEACLKVERWTKSEVLNLLSFPPITNAGKFTKEEITLIHSWIEKGNVRFGFNALHYQGIMGNENEVAGTWEQFFDQLVEGLAFPVPITQLLSGEKPETCPIFPPFCLEFSSADLLNRFIQFMQNLFKDLQVFALEKKTVGEWGVYFLEWVEKTIEIPEEETRIFEDFLSELISFKKVAKLFPDTQIAFSSLAPFIENLLSKKGGMKLSSSQTGIQFGNFSKGSVVPAKVIALLGMNETAFPKKTIESRWFELDPSVPKIGDEERYLFLKALLSARKEVILSFAKNADGNDLQVSSVIEDLENYITKRFGKDRSIRKKHPAFRFHESYFLPSSALKNPCIEDFPGYVALHKKSDAKIERISKARTLSEEIAIKDLCKLTKNPFQFYCQNGLEIYLQRENSLMEQEREEFLLSPLQKALIRRASTRSDSQAFLEALVKSGAMPRHQFGEEALCLARDEAREYDQYLREMNIDKVDIFTLQLDPAVDKPTQVGNMCIFPAIKVQDTLLVGSVADITPRGLLVYEKEDLSAYVKWWPILLILHQIQIPPALIFLPSKSTAQIPLQSSEDALERFIKYYTMSLQEISPLHPKWAKPLLFGESNLFAKAVKNHLSQSERLGFDPYTIWALQRLNLPPLPEMYDKWTPALRSCFHELVTWEKS